MLLWQLEDRPAQPPEALLPGPEAIASGGDAPIPHRRRIPARLRLGTAASQTPPYRPGLGSATARDSPAGLGTGTGRGSALRTTPPGLGSRSAGRGAGSGARKSTGRPGKFEEPGEDWLASYERSTNNFLEELEGLLQGLGPTPAAEARAPPLPLPPTLGAGMPRQLDPAARPAAPSTSPPMAGPGAAGRAVAGPVQASPQTAREAGVRDSTAASARLAALLAAAEEPLPLAPAAPNQPAAPAPALGAMSGLYGTTPPRASAPSSIASPALTSATPHPANAGVATGSGAPTPFTAAASPAGAVLGPGATIGGRAGPAAFSPAPASAATGAQAAGGASPLAPGVGAAVAAAGLPADAMGELLRVLQSSRQQAARLMAELQAAKAEAEQARERAEESDELARQFQQQLMERQQQLAAWRAALLEVEEREGAAREQLRAAHERCEQVAQRAQQAEHVAATTQLRLERLIAENGRHQRLQAELQQRQRELQDLVDRQQAAAAQHPHLHQQHPQTQTQTQTQPLQQYEQHSHSQPHAYPQPQAQARQQWSPAGEQGRSQAQAQGRGRGPGSHSGASSRLRAVDVGLLSDESGEDEVRHGTTTGDLEEPKPKMSSSAYDFHIPDPAAPQQLRAELAAAQSRALRAELALATARNKAALTHKELVAEEERARRAATAAAAARQELDATRGALELMGRDHDALRQQLEEMRSQLFAGSPAQTSRAAPRTSPPPPSGAGYLPSPPARNPSISAAGFRPITASAPRSASTSGANVEPSAARDRSPAPAQPASASASYGASLAVGAAALGPGPPATAGSPVASVGSSVASVLRALRKAAQGESAGSSADPGATLGPTAGRRVSMGAPPVTERAAAPGPTAAAPTASDLPTLAQYRAAMVNGMYGKPASTDSSLSSVGDAAAVYPATAASALESGRRPDAGAHASVAYAVGGQLVGLAVGPDADPNSHSSSGSGAPAQRRPGTAQRRGSLLLLAPGELPNEASASRRYATRALPVAPSADGSTDPSGGGAAGPSTGPEGGPVWARGPGGNAAALVAEDDQAQPDPTARGAAAGSGRRLPSSTTDGLGPSPSLGRPHSSGRATSATGVAAAAAAGAGEEPWTGHSTEGAGPGSASGAVSAPPPTDSGGRGVTMSSGGVHAEEAAAALRALLVGSASTGSRRRDSIGGPGVPEEMLPLSRVSSKVVRRLSFFRTSSASFGRGGVSLRASGGGAAAAAAGGGGSSSGPAPAGATAAALEAVSAAETGERHEAATASPFRTRPSADGTRGAHVRSATVSGLSPSPAHSAPHPKRSVDGQQPSLSPPAAAPGSAGFSRPSLSSRTAPTPPGSARRAVAWPDTAGGDGSAEQREAPSPPGQRSPSLRSIPDSPGGEASGGTSPQPSRAVPPWASAERGSGAAVATALAGSSGTADGTPRSASLGRASASAAATTTGSAPARAAAEGPRAAAGGGAGASARASPPPLPLPPHMDLSQPEQSSSPTAKSGREAGPQVRLRGRSPTHRALAPEAAAAAAAAAAAGRVLAAVDAIEAAAGSPAGGDGGGAGGAHAARGPTAAVPWAGNGNGTPGRALPVPCAVHAVPPRPASADASRTAAAVAVGGADALEWEEPPRGRQAAPSPPLTERSRMRSPSRLDSFRVSAALGASVALDDSPDRAPIATGGTNAAAQPRTGRDQNPSPQRAFAHTNGHHDSSWAYRSTGSTPERAGAPVGAPHASSASPDGPAPRLPWWRHLLPHRRAVASRRPTPAQHLAVADPHRALAPRGPPQGFGGSNDQGAAGDLEPMADSLAFWSPAAVVPTPTAAAGRAPGGVPMPLRLQPLVMAALSPASARSLQSPDTSLGSGTARPTPGTPPHASGSARWGPGTPPPASGSRRGGPEPGKGGGGSGAERWRAVRDGVVYVGLWAAGMALGVGLVLGLAGAVEAAAVPRSPEPHRGACCSPPRPNLCRLGDKACEPEPRDVTAASSRRRAAGRGVEGCAV
ncbi:hypothetical protein HYH03_017867 [Edaphochlamys debaryana]|uniref:Uncharacterized protein n=1 Tax=Edaphochlamys debaryana TaxID=47281 RepID=A0A835XH42_9CHLO|nr:hypothetical protein HYH03_017867 [Edaphochlamys debaryana]|eukprot:KAG2483269.1 hypothetical protein HYH03_017867 [Edaphochlamys debaryana]